MAGAMHPPFRRKKFRSAPSPPGGEDCARSIPSSSPHKIHDFAGAPLLRKERMRRARWKRENGGALDVPPFSANVFGPRRGASGGLDAVESTLSSFRCRYPGGCGGLVGLSPSIGRPSRRGRRPRRPVLRAHRTNGDAPHTMANSPIKRTPLPRFCRIYRYFMQNFCTCPEYSGVLLLKMKGKCDKIAL